ncbi:ABC transporter ATP-binding protein [Geomonas sp. Red69]|uniref:ABC transporter ATP-binding protein n=1 Tax=Geomonas diazotrophica TaxID=2843197 RepID=A0ABX8JLC0_9BACT|nr:MULTISPECIES: ABC transporter ATP-binding protein [Geomonas]MBU5636328.1 ABC transporter ATP-binding protein [Geomonas diazotrophica]QWV99173.1 ABC transporter ATP-binding protein [Geomonas nitrogeniifigens]QXE88342.1 ABC transporter ATP-binding protein [Geomonas nitrogeniifigens]
MPALLEITGLRTEFRLKGGVLKAVRGVDLSVDAGETLALVGESGCGKSITAASVLRLVPPPGRIVSGSIRFKGEDLLALSEERMRQIRGNRIAMVFQDPMTSLNPVFTVGFQVAEGLRIHRALSVQAAEREAVELLTQVGIPAAVDRVRDYPHQLSGGMRQRVMIAMALACAPELVIADEPTTALDVTIQAQILELLDRLMEQNRMGLILITHNLGIVAERAHRTAIMYAGEIVESAPTAELFANPLHPYTKGLLASLPEFGTPGEKLATFAGGVPDLRGDLTGCPFKERCPIGDEGCARETIEMREAAPGHLVRCRKVS